RAIMAWSVAGKPGIPVAGSWVFAVMLLALLSLAGVLVERHNVGGEQRQLAFAGQVALEAVELLAEVGHVLEGAVHGGEAHVGDVVELAQLGHHELAHPPRRQLALGGHAQLVDHRAHRGLGLLFRHGPLVQRAVEALAQLARVEGVAAPVGLDDRRQLQLDGFKRRETLAAGLALAPPPDRRTVLAHARVDDAGVGVLAEGAVHQSGEWGMGNGERELRCSLELSDLRRDWTRKLTEVKRSKTRSDTARSTNPSLPASRICVCNSASDPYDMERNRK